MHIISVWNCTCRALFLSLSLFSFLSPSISLLAVDTRDRDVCTGHSRSRQKYTQRNIGYAIPMRFGSVIIYTSAGSSINKRVFSSSQFTSFFVFFFLLLHDNTPNATWQIVIFLRVRRVCLNMCGHVLYTVDPWSLGNRQRRKNKDPHVFGELAAFQV